VEHTSLFVRDGQPGRAYRIPSLIVLPNDTVLAFAESRANSFLDWGDIDLVVRRSTDGGNTWGPVRTVADAGDRTAGNPCPVYDTATTTVFLPYTVDNKTLMLVASDDAGATWSEPRDLTDEFGLGGEWSTARFDYQYGSGPGTGIQLSSGRLVVPAYFFDERGSHVIYSDDSGATWSQGDTLGSGGEAQVVELPDGRLVMNARNDDGSGRLVAYSSDGGLAWGEAQEDDDLPAIGVMSPLVRSAGLLLYASPTGGSRGRLTVKVSTDFGATWYDGLVAYEGPSAYSSLGVLEDRTVLLLMEAGRLDYRESIELLRIRPEALGIE
jgi:sialidase-1